MAKRKHRRRARRFGSSAAIHKAKAARDMNFGRVALQMMRESLRKGDCKNAVSWLVESKRYYGESIAHQYSYGKKHGRGLRPSNPLRALNSAERRVIDRCVKARPD